MLVVRGNQIEFVPASHENPSDPGVLKRVLAERQHLIDGRVQMINWSCLGVGKSFQRHFHEDMQEVFVILEGDAEMVVNNMTCSLTAGDAILIDPKEVHEMRNVSHRDVIYLVVGISMDKGGKTVVV